MAYSPRLSAPEKNNKYYYANNVFYKSGYGLPNCTCYAWGRFYEISGSYPKLSTSNAENWWSKNDGYSRGKTPKLGAVICWSKGAVGNGSDGAGHVAIVEKIYSDGSILIGQSGWGASRTFWTSKISKGYALSGYKFQGFIYNPAVSSTKSSSSSSNSSSSQSVKFKCIVTAKSGLNVRSGPGTGYKKTSGLSKGTICNIVSTSSNKKWGKLSSGGWISLSYVSKIIMTCKVTANSGLNIRSGPGTNYKKNGILKKGTTCYITEKSSDGKWGKLTSGKGWINLSYVS